MQPSDEVESYEFKVRTVAMFDSMRHAQMPLQSSMVNLSKSLRPLVAEIAVVKLRWEIEQHEAWLTAERDPEAWLNRLVLG